MACRTIINQTKAIALFLALALATVSPGSGLAAAGGANRPLKGSMSGTFSLNPATGAVTGDARGKNSHLGESALHFEGTVAPTAEEGTYAGSAAVTLVAANGDRLTGTAEVTSTATATGRTTSVVMEVTGGTGRFAHASGTLRVICLSEDYSRAGQLLVSEIECTATGQISY
jgi:hypothetical protein